MQEAVLEALRPAATVLFAVAILHTFVWRHVELIFAIWAGVLLAYCTVMFGPQVTLDFLATVHFQEALLVFVVMAITSTRPVLALARAVIGAAASRLPLPKAMAHYVATLILGPLLGSIITEPAAMTVTAILLGESLVTSAAPLRFRYATLALLFVNVSVGGALTHFAAPPVLIVARAWSWDTPFLLAHFGWRAIAIVVSGTLATAYVFRATFAAHVAPQGAKGVASKDPPYVDRLKAAFLVALFLAGLVVLGKLQDWWLAPLITGLPPRPLFFGAAGLTAICDNAAITYLGTLVPGLTSDGRYALVAGALAGGGLTVIANAPNPVGQGLLSAAFGPKGVNPFHLFVAALPYTMFAAFFFLL